MIFTMPMRQLFAVIFDSDVASVTRALLDLGVLHFITINEISPNAAKKVGRFTPSIKEAELNDLRRRIEGLLSIIGIAPAEKTSLNVDDMVPLQTSAVNKYLDGWASRVQALREQQGDVQQEIHRLNEIKRQVDLIGNLNENIGQPEALSFIAVKTGSLPSDRIQAVEKELYAYPSVLLPLDEEIAVSGGDGASDGSFEGVGLSGGVPAADGDLSADKPPATAKGPKSRDDRQEERKASTTIAMVICMKRDQSAVQRILDRYGWDNISFRRNVDNIEQRVKLNLDRKIGELIQERDKIGKDVQDYLSGHSEQMLSLWKNIRLNELNSRIQNFFSTTKKTVIFSGWLPRGKQQEVEAGLRKATSQRYFVEWHDPETGKEDSKEVRPRAPVQMNNPGFLRPFQMLVANYSLPEYRTIDPTPFVAISYLIMFGLMFGDAGHGLVLVLIGLFGKWLFTKSGKGKNLVLLSTLISYCGGAAIVAGILFGSYFGLPLLPPLWFDYHGAVGGTLSGPVHDVYGILTITIYFGISVIAVGLVLNWVNRLRKRDYMGFIFDKAGLLGGWMYAAGVFIAARYVASGYQTLPNINLIFLLVGMPAIMFLLKPPLEYFLHHRHEKGRSFSPMSIVDFAMEWIVEMLEIFSGYLANTLSFMRVAGLGIAHVSLMAAFFQIAEMVSPDGDFTIVSFLILLAGNVLVIALEGLSAGIQSLRLNYYEFFSKYFTGRGKAYEPVSLRNKN